MTIAAALAEIESSPALLDHFDHLEQVIRDEQRRREKFVEELDEDTKAEFINGRVVVHSPVRFGHLKASRCISALLYEYVLKHDLGEILVEKCLVRCRRNDYEPDICFFGKAKCSGWEDDKLVFPPPDLAVEILSPSTEGNDRTVKLRDYARHGVGEYWIIDADARTVEQYVLSPGKNEYELKARLSESGQLASTVLDGFTVLVAAFFDAQESRRTLRTLSEQS